MQYNKDDVPALSPRQKLILAVIADAGSITSTDLVAAFYGPDTIPFNGRATIMTTIREIDRKMQARGEGRILTSGRGGPHPATFSIETP